jgi:hypothetical protein
MQTDIKDEQFQNVWVSIRKSVQPASKETCPRLTQLWKQNSPSIVREEGIEIDRRVKHQEKADASMRDR